MHRYIYILIFFSYLNFLHYISLFCTLRIAECDNNIIYILFFSESIIIYVDLLCGEILMGVSRDFYFSLLNLVLLSVIYFSLGLCSYNRHIGFLYILLYHILSFMCSSMWFDFVISICQILCPGPCCSDVCSVIFIFILSRKYPIECITLLYQNDYIQGNSISMCPAVSCLTQENSIPMSRKDIVRSWS